MEVRRRRHGDGVHAPIQFDQQSFAVLTRMYLSNSFDLWHKFLASPLLNRGCAVPCWSNWLLQMNQAMGEPDGRSVGRSVAAVELYKTCCQYYRVNEKSWVFIKSCFYLTCHIYEMKLNGMECSSIQMFTTQIVDVLLRICISTYMGIRYYVQECETCGARTYPSYKI